MHPREQALLVGHDPGEACAEMGGGRQATPVGPDRPQDGFEESPTAREASMYVCNDVW